MPWCWWNDVASFTAWHDGICTSKQLPKPGRRQSDQSPRILNAWTDAWANPQTFEDGNRTRVVAWVDPANAAGLNVLDAYTVNPDGTVTVRIGNQTRIVDQGAPGFQWRKPKPATYTIDGVTYNTTTGLPI